MKTRTTLGNPPEIQIERVGEADVNTRGFLRLRRPLLRNRYPTGAQSEVYTYDFAERDSMDAVAILLEVIGPEGVSLYLRSALRPPLAFRSEYAVPLADEQTVAVLWEIPAGLVEADERGEAGLRDCAARETFEEVGFELSGSAFSRLGNAVFLSPGVMAEKIHYLSAIVDPKLRGEPKQDGSAVEAHAEVALVPLSEAVHAIRDGRILDVKTEIGIRRLADKHGLQ